MPDNNPPRDSRYTPRHTAQGLRDWLENGLKSKDPESERPDEPEEPEDE